MKKIKISRKTRPANAGILAARAFIEMVHIMYLNDNALEFLNTFTERIDEEFKRRKEVMINDLSG